MTWMGGGGEVEEVHGSAVGEGEWIMGVAEDVEDGVAAMPGI